MNFDSAVPRAPDQDLAFELAHFAVHTDTAALPAPVVQAVKANILDTLCCAIAGSSGEVIDEVSTLVGSWAGTPQADLFVLGGQVPAHHAAWVNGGMAHARDYDDTHDAAVLHAGVSAVPAAIAAAQLRGGVSGSELIAGVAAGLEVTCRLGLSIEVDVMESGFNYTSLLGYFGATAAAARVLGLNESQTVDALGIVYNTCAGNLQVTRDGSLVKRLLPGLAAQSALVAAQLAKAGVKGARHVFEGSDGLYRVYFHGRANGARARIGLGTHYELLDLGYKPYPCCRNTHTAVDATLALRAQVPVDADAIESIRVGVTGPGYQMVCVPEAVRLAPRTVVEAQFSLPYSVAAAWIDGQVGIGHFTAPSLLRADLLALTSRVQPYVDPEIDSVWSRSISPARVTLRLRDGTEHTLQADRPRGHPLNPMSESEFAAKAADCLRFAARPLPPGTAERLVATVASLQQLNDVTDLVRIFTPPPR